MGKLGGYLFPTKIFCDVLNFCGLNQMVVLYKLASRFYFKTKR